MHSLLTESFSWYIIALLDILKAFNWG
jgi:hypothetical protein